MLIRIPFPIFGPILSCSTLSQCSFNLFFWDYMGRTCTRHVIFAAVILQPMRLEADLNVFTFVYFSTLRLIIIFIIKLQKKCVAIWFSFILLIFFDAWFLRKQISQISPIINFRLFIHLSFIYEVLIWLFILHYNTAAFQRLFFRIPIYSSNTAKMVHFLQINFIHCNKLQYHSVKT